MLNLLTLIRLLRVLKNCEWNHQYVNFKLFNANIIRKHLVIAFMSKKNFLFVSFGESILNMLYLSC